MVDLYTKQVEYQIKKEITDFKTKSDTERICLLRAFTFRHIPFALHPEVALDYLNVCIEGKDVREKTGLLFSLENTCEGGFYCGGCAYALMELYISMGYESKFLCIGTDPINSHCVTMVRLPRSGEWYVQDPTFNQTIYDQQGDLMCLNRLISLLMERRHEEIVIGSGGGVQL